MRLYSTTLRIVTLTTIVAVAMLVLMGNYGEPPVVEYPTGPIRY